VKSEDCVIAPPVIGRWIDQARAPCTASASIFHATSPMRSSDPAIGEHVDGSDDHTHRFTMSELEKLVRKTEERSVEVSVTRVASPLAQTTPASEPSDTASSAAVFTKRAPVLVFEDAKEDRRAPETASSVPTAAVSRAARVRDADAAFDAAPIVAPRSAFARRFTLLMLLVAIAVSRPWWFDIGDLRAPVVAAHR
jgi:hypothetical protein